MQLLGFTVVVQERTKGLVCRAWNSHSSTIDHDKNVASIRRNSRVAANNLAAYSSSTAAAAADSTIAVTHSLSNALHDSWSDSQIKEWVDKNGIKASQGSKRDEPLAPVRQHS